MIQYEKTPADEFDWPCDRRVAHRPHHEEWTVSAHGCDGTEEACAVTCPVPEQAVLDCPGVLAHPATMIGTVLRQVSESPAQRIARLAGTSIAAIEEAPVSRLLDPFGPGF